MDRTTPIIIEPARPEDAKQIMIIKRDAQLGAYSNAEHGITTEDIRNRWSDEELNTAIANWRNGIIGETEHSDKRTFVAKVDGKVVGFTSPGLKDGKLMLGAMYVEPNAQGQGAGTALIKKALEWLGSDRDVFVNVVAHNQKAIKFYEHFGFKPTGVELPEETDEQGLKYLREIEMLRKAN